MTDHLDVARRRLAELRAAAAWAADQEPNCEKSEKSEKSPPPAAVEIGSHPPLRIPILYAFEVRWARERGWLAIRDVHTGQWLGVPAKECPPSWIREAQRVKAREKPS
jgi:hypothetical protein